MELEGKMFSESEPGFKMKIVMLSNVLQEYIEVGVKKKVKMKFKYILKQNLNIF